MIGELDTPRLDKLNRLKRKFHKDVNRLLEERGIREDVAGARVTTMGAKSPCLTAASPPKVVNAGGMEVCMVPKKKTKPGVPWETPVDMKWALDYVTSFPNYGSEHIDSEWYITDFNKHWDEKGCQEWHAAKTAMELLDCDEKFVDLRETTALRNAVLHFRVPRNRITRAYCLAALNAKKEKKLEGEEEERRWKREKLSTVQFEKYFTEQENARAKLWHHADVENGKIGRRWKKFTFSRGEDGEYRTNVREMGGEKYRSDPDIPLKYKTDRFGFPKKTRKRRGGRYGRSVLPAAYEVMGEGRNFFVFAADSVDRSSGDRFIFTVFPKSGSVVATGLRKMLTKGDFRHRKDPSELKVPPVFATFAKMTGISVRDITDKRVTNSTWSGTLLPPKEKEVKLGSVMEVLSDYSHWVNTEDKDNSHLVSISFRSQFFPGARLQHMSMKGTINLFNNGSFVIVGVNKSWQARKLLMWLSAIMNEHWKNPLGGRRCVWIAPS